VSCLSPRIFNGRECPCGGCSGCAASKKDEWITRLQLEDQSGVGRVCVTLTYSDENLPAGGNLSTAHYKDFLRRLRKKLARAGVTGLRFFLVGEYGEKTGRPHYHAILWGIPAHLVPSIGAPDGKTYLALPKSERVKFAWVYGHAYVDSLMLQDKSAFEYVCKYLSKTKLELKELRRGRVREFQRMSKNPPIGALAADGIGVGLAANKYAREQFEFECDVPGAVRIAGKFRKLGRTLRRRVRRQVFGSPELSQFQKDERARLAREVSLNHSAQTVARRRRAARAAQIRVANTIYKKVDTF